MALLQISEPGLSAAPHQRRLAAGIDLGTTNSLVATVRSGQAETLPDHQGRYLLPSVVNYQASGLTSAMTPDTTPLSIRSTPSAPSNA
jgi:molecular chaperone HscA